MQQLRRSPWLALVTVTVLAGCAGLLGPDTATDADFAISARVSRAEVAGADTVTITIVVRNPTRRSVRLSDSPCPQFGFEVRSATSERVANGPLVVCLAVRNSPAPRLAPGDSLVGVYQWAASPGPSTGGRREGRGLGGVLDAVPGAGRPLAPGTYRVRGVVLDGEALGARGTAVNLRIGPTS